jgi:hypothetical protein
MSHGSFIEAALERGGRSLGCKQASPVVATIDHVVNRPGKFKSQFARHPTSPT